MNIPHLLPALDRLETKFSELPVCVTLKLDAASLVIENQVVGPAFFSRGGTRPLNEITRAFNQIYDEAIEAALAFDRWEKIPPYHQVFTEVYSPLLMPVIKPRLLDGVVVSTVRDPSGRFLLPSSSVVQKIADDMGFMRPPVVCNRVLTSEERRFLAYGLKDLRAMDFRAGAERLFPALAEYADFYYGPGCIEGLVIYVGSQIFKVIDPQFRVDLADKKDTQSDTMVSLQKLVIDWIARGNLKSTLTPVISMTSEVEFFSWCVKVTRRIEYDTEPELRRIGLDPLAPWFGVSGLALGAVTRDFDTVHGPHIYRILISLFQPKLMIKANPKIGLTPEMAKELLGCVNHMWSQK